MFVQKTRMDRAAFLVEALLHRPVHMHKGKCSVYLGKCSVYLGKCSVYLGKCLEEIQHETVVPLRRQREHAGALDVELVRNLAYT